MFIIFMVLISIILIGCSDDDTTSVEIDDGIYDITLIDYLYYDCGLYGDTCWNSFLVTFEDSDPYNYYKIALVNEGLNTFEKWGGYTQTRGPDTLHLCVAYFDSVPAGDYNIRIYKFSDNNNMNDLDASTGYNQLSNTVRIGKCTDYDSCFTYCCTPSEMLDHYYSQVITKVDNVVGAQAFVRPRYGKLCGEPTSQLPSSGIAYIGINEFISGTCNSSQFGFGVRRENSNDIFIFKYWEVIDTVNGRRFKVDSNNILWYGDLYKLNLELDNSIGLWSFKVNDLTWETYMTNGWENRYGEEIRWAGEIYHYEDDMPGTEAEKVLFSDCKYKIHGYGYDLVDFENALQTYIRCSDTSEWKYSISGKTEVYIWDNNPLP